MKRKIWIPALCLVFLLVLLAVSGPLLVRLGLLKTVFYIQTDASGRTRLVLATVQPASLPALEPGVAPPLEADALPAVIDTDMAPDDWMAILLLLQRPDIGGRANFPFHAAGSLWSTPGDLAVFMIDLMKAYQGETGHLLSPQTARQILSPQIEILNNSLSDAYGLGVELQGTRQWLNAWHSGGTWGSNSIIWFYPQIGKGAVVMINSASGSLLRFEILLSIALAYGWPMN